jgi:hypothetical protein
MVAPLDGEVIVTVIGLAVMKVLSPEEADKSSVFVDATRKWYSVWGLMLVMVMLWLAVNVGSFIELPYAVVVPYSTTLVEA